MFTTILYPAEDIQAIQTENEILNIGNIVLLYKEGDRDDLDSFLKISIPEKERRDEVILEIDNHLAAGKYVVFDQNWRHHFVSRDSIREIMEDTWKENLLSLFALHDMAGREKCEKYLKFLANGPPNLINVTLTTILEHLVLELNAEHGTYEANKQLKSNIAHLLGCFHGILENKRTFLFGGVPGEVASLYLTLLLYVREEISNNPRFNLDPYCLNTFSQHIFKEKNEILANDRLIFQELAKRNGVRIYLIESMNLFTAKEDKEKSFLHFEIFVLHWPEKYPKISFDVILDILEETPSKISSNVVILIKIMLTGPWIFFSALGDPVFREEFETNFERLITKYEVPLPRQRMDGESVWNVFFSDYRVTHFLMQHYDAGRFRNSFYFKQRSLARLAFYRFGQDINHAPVPQECNGPVKPEEFLDLLRTQEYHLLPALRNLIHGNEQAAEVLVASAVTNMDSIQKDQVIFHSGVFWYVLASLISSENSLAVAAQQHLQMLANVFIKSINSMISIGNLKLYYSKIRGVFEQDVTLIERIEKAFDRRRYAEDLFETYYYFDANYYRERELPGKEDPLYQEVLKSVDVGDTDFGYVFISAFVARYTRLASSPTDRQSDQERCLSLFSHVLRRRTRLRQKFYEEIFWKNVCNIFFLDEWALKLLLSQDAILHRPSKPCQRPLISLKIGPRERVRNLFALSYPSFHAKELIGKTILVQFNLNEIKHIREIGSGGEGSVTLINLSGYPTPVIMKKFHAHSGIHLNVADALAEELDALMRLQSHPHIVHVYGFLVDKGEYIGIVMEHCKGGSLGSYIDNQENKYDNTDAIIWIAQAASGFAYLHRNNIYNRDIKPDNMLLIDRPHAENSPRRLKVTDFGLAKMDVPIGYSRTKSTSTNSRCELDGYNAPENDGTIPYASSMDVFRFGRSIWHIYYRVIPMFANWSETPKIPIPAEVQLVMNQMMDEDPNNRLTMELVFNEFYGMRDKDLWNEL